MTNEIELENLPNAELREPRWSVISFDKREARNLTYAEAEMKLAELLTRKVSGLCIITNEAAAKMAETVSKL